MKNKENKFDGIGHLPLCENHCCPGCIAEEEIGLKICPECGRVGGHSNSCVTVE